MEIEETMLERVGKWDDLSRWERSELGRDMRREGLSYGEIIELIDVKKSTLATWCNSVKLTEEQIKGIKDRTGQVAGLPRDTQWRRREEIETIWCVAQQQVPVLTSDPLWLAGIVLYWAEGSKTRNKLSMANTDPRALRLFIAWVRGFLLPEADFRLHLHLHEGNDERAAKSHWREVLELPEAKFHKTFIKPKGTGHRKNNHLHGVCTVRALKSADAFQTIAAWLQVVPAQLGVADIEA